LGKEKRKKKKKQKTSVLGNSNCDILGPMSEGNKRGISYLIRLLAIEVKA
jgi:hypothetical protein